VAAKAKNNFLVAQLKSQAGVLRFAARLEQGAVSAYLGAVAKQRADPIAYLKHSQQAPECRK
jgi:hypothetical protein